MILPTLALVLSGYAMISRYQRASMLEVLNQDYIRLARMNLVADLLYAVLDPRIRYG